MLALYCGVLAFVLPHHEPWGDEAQAWLLASNNSAWQIVRHSLHYEGAPAMWHLLLHALAVCHGGFAGVGWMGASFAVLGRYVLLRWSPFPLIVRVLLPFTFFLQYQYAVIARSYTLFALLLFSACALYRRRRTVRFAIAAGLLANLSVQGMIVASLIAALYAWDLYQDYTHGFHTRRARLGAAVLTYAALAGFACFVAIPAPDVNFAVSDTVSGGTLHKMLVRFCGETENFFPEPPAARPYLPPAPDPPKPRVLPSPAAWAAWELNHRERDANGFQRPETPVQSAAEFVLSIASQATWPVLTSNLLACALLGLMFLWLRRKRSLRVLLPWFAIMLFGQVVWVADHHVGMIFIVMIAGIWIAAERRPAPRSRLDTAFINTLAVVLALQVVWSAVCIRRDIKGSYDPGRETAKYMLQHLGQSTAAFHYLSVSIQPYFDHIPSSTSPPGTGSGRGRPIPMRTIRRSWTSIQTGS
ncbi:MAG: hypothetical protein M3O02_08895 [Acidobacteriota bacterium]|nr:hypothetical protein [Acidobacteriota bacterium]